MTTRRIEELANEVAREIGQHFAGFRIDRADVLLDGLDVTFSWTQPTRTIVHLQIRDQDTDTAIKATIRRQLTDQLDD
jgi:hypothetical protein